MEEGKFPSEWKGALVKPKLKKADLDLIKENFRPLSNLQFLSKLTEKAVAQKTLLHIVAHALFPDLQSAYCRNCSTETALLRVRNDILFNMNRQHVTLLVYLDLSAAFDTIDHLTPLDRLRDKFGMDGVVLEWFRSYLTDRSQQVIIGSDRSRPMDVHYGVPQGSCLGPLLFSIYTSQIFDIVSDHLPNVHCFADDTQLYLSFRPDDQASQDAAVAAKEACIRDVRLWMLQDKLKINDAKTEFLLIGTRPQLKKVDIDSLKIGDSVITPSKHAVRNLGSWFDETFSMQSHVNKTCKAGYYYLNNLSRIRKYLDKKTTECLVHAFITSRLDYCNSLLYGLPDRLISKLQRVQNAAARLVYKAPRFCHTSPILEELHWLPIRDRIKFKVILITFKTIKGAAPNYLQELISFKGNSSYGLRSNDSFLLAQPRQRTLTTLGDRTFAVAAPKLWNCLPVELRNPNISIESFKVKLKTHLFREAYR